MKLSQTGYYQRPGKRQLKQLLHLLLTPTPSKSLFLCQDAFAKKLYICFQEVGGKFGKRVSETLQHNQPPNIEYDCSTSGKMLTALVLSWMCKVLQPELKGASLLLLDSWSDQTDTGLSARAFRNRELNSHTNIIHPKTTKYCQPLYVYFFR